jgi:hypothetical protein
MDKAQKPGKPKPEDALDPPPPRRRLQRVQLTTPELLHRPNDTQIVG